MLLVSYNNIKASRDACILGHQLSLQAYTDMSSSLPVFTFLSWRNNQTPIQQPGSFGLSSLPLNSLVSLEIWNCSPNLGHTIIGKLGLTPCGPVFIIPMLPWRQAHCYCSYGTMWHWGSGALYQWGCLNTVPLNIPHGHFYLDILPFSWGLPEKEDIGSSVLKSPNLSKGLVISLYPKRIPEERWVCLGYEGI